MVIEFYKVGCMKCTFLGCNKLIGQNFFISFQLIKQPPQKLVFQNVSFGFTLLYDFIFLFVLVVCTQEESTCMCAFAKMNKYLRIGEHKQENISNLLHANFWWHFFAFSLILQNRQVHMSIILYQSNKRGKYLLFQ